MSYVIMLECDGPNCNSKTTVPQVGMMPVGWVAVRQLLKKASHPDAKDEAITSTFCSNKCLIGAFSNE